MDVCAPSLPERSILSFVKVLHIGRHGLKDLEPGEIQLIGTDELQILVDHTGLDVSIVVVAR